MAEYENNAYFWQKADTLYLSSNIKLTKKKGEPHSTYKNLTYPVDFGYLSETGKEGYEIEVFIGSKPAYSVECMLVGADILEKTINAKLLLGCTPEEEYAVLDFMNKTNFQKTVLLRRGKEIPSWAMPD